jgi:hypothetical protein
VHFPGRQDKKYFIYLVSRKFYRLLLLDCISIILVGNSQTYRKRHNGLIGKSKKPHSSSNQKINKELIELVLALRKKRNLGVRRIQTELIRLHECSLSLATIHKVLTAQHA